MSGQLALEGGKFISLECSQHVEGREFFLFFGAHA